MPAHVLAACPGLNAGALHALARHAVDGDEDTLLALARRTDLPSDVRDQLTGRLVHLATTDPGSASWDRARAYADLTRDATTTTVAAQLAGMTDPGPLTACLDTRGPDLATAVAAAGPCPGAAHTLTRHPATPTDLLVPLLRRAAGSPADELSRAAITRAAELAAPGIDDLLDELGPGWARGAGRALRAWATREQVLDPGTPAWYACTAIGPGRIAVHAEHTPQVWSHALAAAPWRADVAKCALGLPDGRHSAGRIAASPWLGHRLRRRALLIAVEQQTHVAVDIPYLERNRLLEGADAAWLVQACSAWGRQHALSWLLDHPDLPEMALHQMASRHGGPNGTPAPALRSLALALATHPNSPPTARRIGAALVKAGGDGNLARVAGTLADALADGATYAQAGAHLGRRAFWFDAQPLGVQVALVAAATPFAPHLTGDAVNAAVALAPTFTGTFADLLTTATQIGA